MAGSGHLIVLAGQMQLVKYLGQAVEVVSQLVSALARSVMIGVPKSGYHGLNEFLSEFVRSYPGPGVLRSAQGRDRDSDP